MRKIVEKREFVPNLTKLTDKGKLEREKERKQRKRERERGEDREGEKGKRESGRETWR